MNRLVFAFIFTVFIFILPSCSMKTKTMMRNDPLIGKIIDTVSQQSIDFESLVDKIREYDVIYLSEKHDNSEHHNIQQKIIKRLVEKGRTPTIAFEFFSMDNTPDLLNFIDAGKVKHSKKAQIIIEADLRKKLGWDTQSDTMWQYYYHLLTLARDNNLEAAGIDLAATLKKRITRKGLEGITPIEKEELFLTQLSNKAYKAYMISIFKTVHCGMGNEKMMSRIYDTWISRNDKMAFSITRLHHYGKGPVVVIIGGGHTEYGLGVIDRVAAINKDIRQVNLALKEIKIKPSDLKAYLSPLELQGYKPVPPADFIWFTQRSSYKNPCEAFKKNIKATNFTN